MTHWIEFIRIHLRKASIQLRTRLEARLEKSKNNFFEAEYPGPETSVESVDVTSPGLPGRKWNCG